MKRVGLLVLFLASCSLISLDDLHSGDAGIDSTSPEGGCGDTTSSPKNCGACGHDCLGGACTTSACQPTPLASVQAMPSALALENGWLYWISQAAIHRAPTSLDAGTSSQVGNGTIAGLFALAPVSPTIHAIDTTPPGAAVTVAEDEPPNGNAPTSTAYNNILNNVFAFAWDGGHEFVYTNSGACKGGSGWCILAFDDPPMTSTQKRFADNLDNKSGHLAIDGGRVFYASGTTIGTFVYTDSSGTSTILATTSDPASSIAADTTSVYVSSLALGSILAMPRAGMPDGGAPTPIATGQNNPCVLAAHAGIIAWGSCLTPTMPGPGLWACDPKACVPKKYDDAATVTSIVIDDQAIYWTDKNRAGIYKVAR
jgi:hypothetical protein